MKWFGLKVRNIDGGETLLTIVGGKNRRDAKRRYLETHSWMKVLSVWEI